MLTKVGDKVYSEILILCKTVRKFTLKIFTSGYVALLVNLPHRASPDLEFKERAHQSRWLILKLGCELYRFSQSEKIKGWGPSYCLNLRLIK